MERILIAVLLVCIVIFCIKSVLGAPQPQQPTQQPRKFNLLRTLFGSTPAPKPGAKNVTFQTNFSGGFDASKWKIAEWQSADTIVGVNKGVYDKNHFDFAPGFLRIWIDQVKDPVSGVDSFGSLFQSVQKFGFGTYTFVMRESTVSPTADGAGGTVTGGVSSAFLYLPNSESEIDLEFLGDNNAMWGTNWKNPNPAVPPTFAERTTTEFSNSDLATGFHTYQMVWTSKAVAWYIDGKLVANHTSNVPQAPAYIMLQHRGTNSNQWGGTATVGVRRYAFFKSVSYTPETN